MTYVVACSVLAVAALLASIVPARRALGVDPISAVRGSTTVDDLDLASCDL